MDSSKYMIVDLKHLGEPQMFLTDRVDTIEMQGVLYCVSFIGQSRKFLYNPRRLLAMRNPEEIDADGKGLYIDKRRVRDVRRILKFSNEDEAFYHIEFDSGSYMNYEGRRVHISRTDIRANNPTLWNFLNHLAAETGLLMKIDGQEDNIETVNILTRQYGMIDEYREDVPLAKYLGMKRTLRHTKEPDVIIYPFGCNASQKLAVERALSNQVSIIQGPPGTGKTQTILNIIANLIVAGKNALIVSNNNSAMENIAEKLDYAGIGFMVARLGNSSNKKNFLENQSPYPDFTEWRSTEADGGKKLVCQCLDNLSRTFRLQRKLKEVEAELRAIKTESQYDAECHKNKWTWSAITDSATAISILEHLHRCNGSWMARLLWRINCLVEFGFKIWKSMLRPTDELQSEVESTFYLLKAEELDSEREAIADALKSNDFKNDLATLRDASFSLLKDSIAKRYEGKESRVKFEQNRDIWINTQKFLHEYPIVLSTTYSSKSNISRDHVFDYVIMDEASQVDIATGALAISCAENAVIVGDDKQLPNVIPDAVKLTLKDIEDTYGIADRYRASSHSFLKSCMEVFHEAPVTLLREHYRCHPKIIEFCNKMFYDGELISMTEDKGEKDVINIIRTVPGNHARGHLNKREVSVIESEVMQRLRAGESIGIITPYRDQAAEINEALRLDKASTVHKYQGRECDSIVMSMVDNEPTPFSDDSNLMNVAISRAKRHLYLVATGNDISPQSNLAQLIAYASYNNFDVVDSQVHSIFDILYRQYTDKRLEYERSHKGTSDELSESLIYETLKKALDSIHASYAIHIGIVMHYPLSRIISDTSLLTEGEIQFVSNNLSHVDFLLYNTVTKRPMACVEVDGWKYHRQKVQIARDEMKDGILARYGLRPLRLSTTDVVDTPLLKTALLRRIGIMGG